ncbi:MAG: hypothetical protein AB7O66_07810 [Limisphaerales bacterium]
MNPIRSVPSAASHAVAISISTSVRLLLGALLVPQVAAPAQSPPNHAAEVAAYSAGLGAASGYQDPSVALGAPSRITPGEFGGPVDPFSAPWQAGQLVSIGNAGSLTVRFQYPVLNLAGNPHGLDFLIFGSAAFLITNGDYSGGGITDGSLFGQSAGPTRVSVSADGSLYFPLDLSLAPTVDRYFPTDGAGDFTLPVNPGLREADFNGLGLAGIRALYEGSGGGTGFDIGWARNSDGSQARLDSIQFVRVDVLADRVEIDGFSAVPEPSTGVLTILGALVGLAGAGFPRKQIRHPRP